jgi:tetratricopeptide (TPR) repeat protein
VTPLETPTGRILPTAQRFFETGKAAQDKGDPQGAEHHFAQALRLDPNHGDSLTMLAGIVANRRNFRAALALAQRAANLDEENPAYLANLGTTLFRVEQYEEAFGLLWRAKQIAEERIARNTDREAAGEEVDPNDVIDPRGLAGIWHNLGLARLGLRDPMGAVGCFLEGRKLGPEEDRIKRDLGLALLATGRFGEGLLCHEARWSDLFHYPIWDSGIPRWTGQPLAGKTIIVHHEQGFGDTLQFMRFMPWLRERGAHVIAAVTQPMMRLTVLSELADEVIAIDGPLPAADYHSPMLSVPAFLDLTLETIPSAPYLKAPTNVPGWPLYRAPGVRLVVGVVWAGSPGYEPDLKRSMPFEEILGLADIPQITLVSLQKGDRVGDIARAGASALVPDLSGYLGDFADTAAALMQIDVLVSVDTSVLHLAGALGRPCIAMLPYRRCWRWLVNRDDTPWYPTMTLVTQESPNDWSSVVGAVREMLLQAQIEETQTVIAYDTIEIADAVSSP